MIRWTEGYRVEYYRLEMIISRSSGRTYIIWDGGNLSPITFGICVKLMPIRSDSNQRGILSHGHLLLRSPWLSPRRILVPCTLNLKMVRRARNHFFWWQIICIDISKGWCCKDFQLTMKGHLKVSAVLLGKSLLKVTSKSIYQRFIRNPFFSSTRELSTKNTSIE